MICFGFQSKKNISKFPNAAVEILLQFCTTYMCVQSFSSLLPIKNDKRSCIKNIDNKLLVALSNVEPNIKQLYSLKQAQISY